jgi:hypothetical protein
MTTKAKTKTKTKTKADFSEDCISVDRFEDENGKDTVSLVALNKDAMDAVLSVLPSIQGFEGHPGFDEYPGLERCSEALQNWVRQTRYDLFYDADDFDYEKLLSLFGAVIIHSDKAKIIRADSKRSRVK